MQAYRFALDPTPRQERALMSHAGASRVAYNRGLARIKANLGRREAERWYSIADEDLTPPVGWSMYSLRKDWNQAKDTVAVVGGELERGLRPRTGTARYRAQELVGLPQG